MAEVKVHRIGALVRVTGTLTTAAGATVDPTAVVVKLKAPSGTITSYTLGVDLFPAHDGVGTFHVDVTPTEVGEYYYQFRSTGTGQAMDEGMFRVEASAI